MTNSTNIYCDETCHLENDGIDVMVLGAVSCPADEAARIARNIRELKMKHGMEPGYEIKWTKVSESRAALFLDVVDYFFDEPDLRYRGVIISPKSALAHDAYDQDHDTWYFKMYYYLLNALVGPDRSYRVFLDIKDTQSARRVHKLHEVLCNSSLDFNHEHVRDIQTVDSKQVQQIQVVDLLTGAIGYENRDLRSSSAKLKVVQKVKTRSGLGLRCGTSRGRDKVDLFKWTPRGT